MKIYNHLSTENWTRSLLFEFQFSQTHVKAKIEAGEIKSDALLFGSAFHAAVEKKPIHVVLNPDERPEPDKTFGSKLNKAWKAEFLQQAENDGKILLDLEEANKLQFMVKSLHNSEIFQKLQNVQFIGAEQYYKAELFGLKLKCKPDFLAYGKNKDVIICVDWKSTREKLTGNPVQLKYICKSYGIDFQAVHYTETLKKALGKEVVFCPIFVEKTEPFSVLPAALMKGSELYENAYIKWMQCVEDAKTFNIEQTETLEKKIKRQLENEIFVKL